MSDYVGIRQIGWEVKDPIALAKFYQDVMGMTVVAQMPANSPMGAMVFLSRHPGTEEHHDLALFSSPMLAYTAFRVDTLDDFMALYYEVKEKAVPIRMTFNHGASFAFYFSDPEGHNIEIYWPTYARVPLDYQPQPINLDLPKEEIQGMADRLAAQYGRLTPAGSTNPVSVNQEKANQGNASQWGQEQAGANHWNQNQGSTDQANPSQWGQGQGEANQWNQGGAGQGNEGDWNKQVIETFRANGGKVAMLPTPVILITTTGRKSGKPYTTPVGYMVDVDRLIVVPSSNKADWYLNVLANPQVMVELGTETFTAIASDVEGEQRGIFLRQAHQVAEAAASAWRPPDAGDMSDHLSDNGPVVALRRVDQ